MWLLSFWVEYDNNYYYFFFWESKFIVYLCNLRCHHNRFQTLRGCCRGIFNFPTLIIWEIDLFGTFYIHADFQTYRIYRTAELEVPIPIFLHYCYKLHFKLLQKQISITLLWLNLKIQEFEIYKVKFLKLNPTKFTCYHNISIFPKPT